MPAVAEAPQPSAPWLVLGLGNPDPEYANTRHNAGAMVVRLLAERFGARLRRSRQRAEVAEVRDGDARIVLARPSGYVNESGGPASLLVRYYKVPLEQVIVVHDEIDLAAGKLQVRRGDRKSTRLNSSHVAISYAVFCLKKKKNKINC